VVYFVVADDLDSNDLKSYNIDNTRCPSNVKFDFLNLTELNIMHIILRNRFQLLLLYRISKYFEPTVYANVVYYKFDYLHT